MEEDLKKFHQITTDPYTAIAEWKEKTRSKVIGCYPMHVPEEIVDASGMLPVVCWPSSEPVTVGHAYWTPFNCGLTRSFVDDVVLGRLKFMDGLVIHTRLCNQAEGNYSIIDRNARPHYLERLILPAIYPNPVTREFFAEELERFKMNLENFSGQKITHKALSSSIKVYNRDRALLRQLYELRRRKPTAIKASEVAAIVQAAMLMPKEEHAQKLEKLLPQLEARTPSTNGKTRVILAGCLCHPPTVDVLDLIEDLNMTVVDDDIYVGSRYFLNDAAINSNPMHSLEERYFKKIPPSLTLGDYESNWGDYIVSMVKNNQAQGVISLMPKFCPPHLCYYADFKRKLTQAGILEVLVELEHEIVSLQGIKTRLQAFNEIMKGRQENDS